MKYLVVVDMQNDFITGSLKNGSAKRIIPDICEYIGGWDGAIIATMDTHIDAEYLDSPEGKKLPIKHCIYDTPGWSIERHILDALSGEKWFSLHKSTFAYDNWSAFMQVYFSDTNPEEFCLVGTCTDICVIANALVLKTIFPNAKIKVVESLCAGTTRKNHNAAIATMKSCQIEVI